MRDGDSNIFRIQHNPQSKLCPVQGIEQYLAISDQLKVDLRSGYLFWSNKSPWSHSKLNEPISSAVAEARLKTYLKEMGSDNGETLHGFHSGCAITLALSGIELSEVMDHVGWTQQHTALYYLQLAKVLNPSGASARLAQVDLSSATSQWEDLNELKRFVSAFPVDASRKHQFEESK